MMRFTVLITIAATIVSALAQPKVVDKPAYFLSNTSTVKVERVELTDTSTRVTFAARFRPRYWIRIDPGTSLQADGKIYATIGSDGIILGEKHWMPDTGRDTFTVSFEPMPRDIEHFNLIEGTSNNDFRIYGIDINGALISKAVPNEVTAEMKRLDLGKPIPSPIFERKPVTVNVRAANWHKDYPSKMGVATSQSSKGFPIELDSNGCAHFTFDANFTNLIMLYFVDDPYTHKQAIVNPGDTVNIIFDAVGGSRNDRENSQSLWEDGIWADYNNMSQTDTIASALIEQYIIPAFDYTLDATQLTERMIDSLASAKKHIQSLNLPQMYRQFLVTALETELYSMPFAARYYISRSYLRSHPDERDMPSDSLRAVFGPEQFALISSAINFDDPAFFVVSRCNPGFYKTMYSPYSRQGSLSDEIHRYSSTLAKASDLTLTDADIDSLRMTRFGYLADHCIETRDSIKREIDALPKTELQKTPDVTPDKIIESIVSSHPGKVVVIDLWNTWCGPCRAAMERIKPIKAEFADKDVVWIYVADNSSTLSEYYKMIHEIHGDHYLLNEQQIQGVRAKYNVDGIPFYIVADRNGQIKTNPAFRNLDNLKAEVQKALGN